MVLLLLIIIPLLIMVILQFTPSHRNAKKLNTIYHEIINCNLSLNEATSNKILVPTKAEELLTKGILDLTDIHNSLNNSDIPTSNLKSKLLDTLNSDISLYESTLTLLKNPDSENTVALINEYNNNILNLTKEFEELRLLGLNSDFKDCIMNFFEASSDFINTAIKLNREHDITSAQNKDFILSLNLCVKSLNEISEDLRPALESIRTDNRSLDVLTKDIKEKKSKLNKIKNQMYSLTIPEKGSDYSDELTSVLNFYELYLLSLENSINIEKNNINNCSQNDISNNYINSFSKYDDFSSSLSEFKTNLDNFNK